MTERVFEQAIMQLQSVFEAISVVSMKHNMKGLFFTLLKCKFYLLNMYLKKNLDKDRSLHDEISTFGHHLALSWSKLILFIVHRLTFTSQRKT